MKKTNLYWPIFKNLEKEVLALAEVIHFCDEQLNVYSIKIAELLIRCVVEIESISKELYEQNGGNMCPTDANNQQRDLYFDTDCLGLLEQKWGLSKKQILVSASILYFEKEENRVLTPLKKANKRGSSGSDWKQAYQAVKHNRGQNLNRANIKHLIRAMAALYLLNIYYRDENFSASSIFTAHSDFDRSLGSSLFSIKLAGLAHANQIDGQNSMGTVAMLIDSVYIFCFPIQSIQKIRELEKVTLQKQENAISSSKEYNDFINSGEHIKDCPNLVSVAQKVGRWAYKRKITSLPKNEQLKAIYDSVEYKWIHENCFQELEKIADDDIDALCVCVGDWDYSRRVIWQYEEAFVRERFNSNLDIVLNKGQDIYANNAYVDVAGV